MTRFKAFSIHLGCSLIIFAALAALVVWVWYPGFFFETDGGWQGIRIIVLVDLVLGPLLTLVVYKAGKPGLKMDLTLIALFQTACLIAGTYVVYSERPLALVYVDGQFNSVTADTFEAAGMAVPDFDQYPGPSPKWVMVNMPQDPTEQSKLRRAVIERKLPSALLVDQYVAFDPEHSLFTDGAAEFSDIKARDHDNVGATKFFGKFGANERAYRFYPYAARYQYFYLAFNEGDSELVGTLTTHSPEPANKP
ncbi:MAG: hypothetical protein AB8B93_03195 [Pseudomonadales bacterium]